MIDNTGSRIKKIFIQKDKMAASLYVLLLLLLLLLVVVIRESTEAVANCHVHVRGEYTVTGPDTEESCVRTVTDVSCQDIVYLKSDGKGYQYERRCSADECTDAAAVTVTFNPGSVGQSQAVQCCNEEDYCNTNNLLNQKIGPKCIKCEGNLDKKDDCLTGKSTVMTDYCDYTSMKCNMKVKKDGSISRGCTVQPNAESIKPADITEQYINKQEVEYFCSNEDGCNNFDLSELPYSDNSSMPMQYYASYSIVLSILCLTYLQFRLLA